jgi:hypothetical protein
LLPREFGEFALAVADRPLRFAQRVRSLGLRFAGLVHLALHRGDAFAQVLQLFLLAGVCRTDEHQAA